MKIENNQFILEKKPKGMGCLYVGLSIIGFIIILGASFYIYIISDEINLMNATIPTFMIMLGSIFFLSGFSYKLMQLNSTVIIDREKQTVTFYKDEKRKYSFGLGTIAFVQITKVMKMRSSSSSSAQNRSYPTYQVFLVKKDGSHFWLDTFLNQKNIKIFVESLYDYCGLAIHDYCGFSLDQDAREKYANEYSDPIPPPSKFIVIEETEKGKKINIKKKKSLFMFVLISIVFLLFFTAPILVFFAGGNPGIFFIIFFVIFGLFWYSILFFIVSIMMKRYTLYLKYNELVLDIGFKLGFIDKFWGSVINIPRDKIKYVRVHRLDESSFWLAVSADANLKSPEPNFFLKMGFLSKDSVSGLFPNEKVFGLWEISGMARSNQEADYLDLLYLENLIEKQFFLREKAING